MELKKTITLITILAAVGVLLALAGYGLYDFLYEAPQLPPQHFKALAVAITCMMLFGSATLLWGLGSGNLRQAAVVKNDIDDLKRKLGKD